MQDGPRIYQLNLSAGGVPKHPVQSARVGELGLEGDAHRNMQAHGGPERALCLYSLEQIQALQAEGHPVQPGWLGENVTTAGVDLTTVQPGDRLQLGAEVQLEITKYVTPCTNITAAFKDGRFERVLQTKYPDASRLYARVLRGGTVQTGDPVHVFSARPAAG